MTKPLAISSWCCSAELQTGHSQHLCMMESTIGKGCGWTLLCHKQEPMLLRPTVLPLTPPSS